MSKKDLNVDAVVEPVEPELVVETAGGETAVVEAEVGVVDDKKGSLTELIGMKVTSSWVLLVCAILGMAASVALTLERIELLINPSYVPSCSINPVLSCGSVMVTEQARFFGFPNPLLGLPAFAVIITTAVLVVGRVKLPRWYWIGQTLVTFLGVVFINYLVFQSLYRIGALCPYCMVVWTITPIILMLSFSRCLGDSLTSMKLRDASWVVLAFWYIAVITAIAVRFWYYWKTLF